MTTNDKNTQRFIVELGNGAASIFVRPPSLLYMCTEGRSYLPCFSSVHLHPTLPRASGAAAYHPARPHDTRQTNTYSNTFAKGFHSRGDAPTIFLLHPRATWHPTRGKECQLWVQRETLEFGLFGVWLLRLFGNVSPGLRGAGRLRPYEKHIFQITTMRKENIQMKIPRYGAPGAAAWKILRGGRVLLNDIFRHALLLLLTHGSDIGYSLSYIKKETRFRRT